MEAREVKKLYYSIGEVSEITGLKQYVLRYWETEFSHIKPTKNRAGNRVYRSADLDNIKELKNLLHNQKFTIKGAKQYLKEYYSNKINEGNKILNISNNIDKRFLTDMRDRINHLIDLINDSKQ